MNVAAALIYWAIVVLWLIILATIVVFYVRNPRAFGTTRLLLAVLALDALRNIFENCYFGLYFGSRYGLLPAGIETVLGRPGLLITPKVLNLFAGGILLGILLLRWLPLAVRERGRAEQHASALEKLATVDWLTGLHNRRHFEALLRAELARYQRYMRPFSVMLVDIDHFKTVNDRFGHAAGDQMLQATAAACQATKREADIVARVGGDELAFMLPETTDTAAMQFAERLRQQIKANPVTVRGEPLAVTVSIGIAGARPKIAGTEVLLRQADEALYEAKRAGRNCAVVWRPPDTFEWVEAAE